MAERDDEGRVLEEAISLLCLGAGTFFAISLLSFSPVDYASLHFPTAERVSNLCGRVGADLALFALRHIGTIPAYALAGILVLFGVQGARSRGVLESPRVLAGVFLLVSLASVEHIGRETVGLPGPLPGRLAGGFVGAYCGSQLLGAFQTTGALVVLGVLSSVAGVVVLDGRVGPLRRDLRDVLAAAEKRVRSAKETASAVKKKVAERKEKKKKKKKKSEKKETKKSEKTEKEATKGSETDDDEDDEEDDDGRSFRIKLGGSRPGKKEKEKEKKKKKPAKKKATPEDDDEGAEPPSATGEGYRPPTAKSLATPEDAPSDDVTRQLEERVEVLEEALDSFGIEAEVVSVEKGPNITMFELRLASGTKVSSVSQRSDDLAVALMADSVRVVAPLPGRDTIGLEVPNLVQEIVRLRELLESDAAREGDHSIPLFLGKKAIGDGLILDLARAPHLLIAGATGSGKSVSINSLIMSILMTRRPDEVKLILIDPKMVELSLYEDVPHLLAPVVTDMNKAQSVLDWAVQEMESRYELLQQATVRHVDDYNELSTEKRLDRMGVDPEDADGVPDHLHRIVIVIDEMADLMMVAKKEVEGSITRIAQKARAVGLHLILATQRPSVDVITGLIKSNVPTRIAFEVTSSVDSRTILDQNGAEQLIGKGDMLLLPPRSSTLVRAQGTLVEDDEVRAVCDHLRAQAEPQYSKDLQAWHERKTELGDRDELWEDAVRVILGKQRGSASLLQRQLSIGYTRASRILDQMEEAGLVGPHRGSKARAVNCTLEEWEEHRA